MNIFVTDNCPILSAKRLADRHIVKMPLETAQMLSTAIQTIANKRIDTIYKIAHLNHPCSIWTRESSGNFLWLHEHGIALCNEYNLRYGKVHSSLEVINNCYSLFKSLSIEDQIEYDMTQFAKAMPDEHKSIKDPILAYKSYLKSKYSEWQDRGILTFSKKKYKVSEISWI